MSKPELTKKSGWLFIAAAFAFLTLLIGWDPISIPGSLGSSILLAAAMSGLRTAYSERIGRLGRNTLLLGMSGPVLWVVSLAFMALMGVEAIRKGGWVLLFVGPAISLLGLTLFGLTAIVSKPLARLNWLPLFAGIWYPVTFVLFSVYDISRKGVFPHQAVPAIVLMVVIQFIALCSLGFTLIENASKELVAA